jgi:trans-aconitate 2-methyltransferase
MTSDSWNPEQYDRFREERSQPFYDLADLVHARSGMRVLDLGCGSGRLTAWLHGHLGAGETLGVDSSPSMLRDSADYADAEQGIQFVEADLADYTPDGQFDLIFSNAALQWLPDHAALFARISRWVAPGGQLAVQMPANFGHPSHRTAAELAAEPPFADALDGWVRVDPVGPPEDYSVLLAALGLRANDVRPSPHVRQQIYLHELERSLDVLQWVKGSLLTAYERRMSAALFGEFVERYEQRLLRDLGDQRPYLYPFKRLLLWGQRPG